MAPDLTPTGGTDYRRLSLWWDDLDEPVVPGEPLTGDLDVDVAVVGAGYTGLWTARSLLQHEPGLRVAVIEREVAGYGASGRNGGWCSALFAASDARICRDQGLGAANAMRRAMEAAVDEVGAAAADEGIDCHFSKGGTVKVARGPAQVARAQAEVAEAHRLGSTDDDLRWLGPDEARALLGAEGVDGATYTPHCAALHPARLARGLASAVRGAGARVFEGTEATGIDPGAAGRRPVVRTVRGDVTADVVVRAVEAWTPSLPGDHLTIAPIYSMMIATEPLDDAFWSRAGLGRRETFADYRHLIIYGQRTADGRLAFGGRGAPYHFGSQVRPSFDRSSRVHDGLHRTLLELFPSLEGAAITHRWGGPIGVPRDWFSSVGLDRRSGVAWAGGYVGDGVSTTNLAGRTLADLILERDTPLVHLPWVGHRSPRWEPEPLRWLGVNGGLLAMAAADHSEQRRGQPSRLAGAMGRLLGH